jgi:hypothetical protein
VHFAIKSVLPFVGALMAISAACTSVQAESAYIAQAKGNAPASMTLAQPPIQMVPTQSYAPRQTSFVPTPEATSGARSTNFAQTLQMGASNSVLQAQVGGNNYSNVGVLGGNDNNVAVLQGGRDYSNLQMLNTQGLTVAVIQPPGSTPINMLIARLPNGGLLIKR